MELFDFAKLIGGFIHFSGSFEENFNYINAHLKVGSYNVTDNGISLYGRTDGTYAPISLDLALINLALVLRGKRICCDAKKHYNVPADLMHTVGYRGK
jgi:hypothetical protein